MPFVVYVARRYGLVARPSLQEVQQRVGELTSEAEESLSGVRLVRAFAREDRQRARFRDSADRVFTQSMIATRLRAFYNPLIGLLPRWGWRSCCCVGGRAVVNGSLTIGEFTAFYGYVLALLGPMRTLGNSLGMAQRAVASGERIFEILDRAPQISAPEHPVPLPEGNGRIDLDGVACASPRHHRCGERRGSARARRQRRRSRGAHRLGQERRRGARLAALRPDRGHRALEGVDLRELDPITMRHQIAVVDDDPFLFSATVAENIAYARPDASQEEIELAARRAQIHDTIVGLDDGYDTWIGERGLTLSGGQRQRLAIARALLADPRVLVLDDATAAVDAATELRLVEALREAVAGRTALLIASRPATLALADEIVVMDGGRVIDRGRAPELRERCPLFRDLTELGAAHAPSLALAAREEAGL